MKLYSYKFSFSRESLPPFQCSSPEGRDEIFLSLRLRLLLTNKHWSHAESPTLHTVGGFEWNSCRL